MRPTIQKPRYALESSSLVTNGSWWAGQSRDAFTHYAAAQEWPRMRSAYFGRLSVAMTLGRSEPNACEAYRLRKRMAARAGMEWEQA
jgi:hypothetical protein